MKIPEKGHIVIPSCSSETNYPLIDRECEVKVVPYRKKIPVWSLNYFYSLRELEVASPEIKAFYKQFKDAFLKGRPYNIKENHSYSFALLYDLLEEYVSHRNLTRLEAQIHLLIKYYPKITSYAEKEFVKRVKERGVLQPTEEDPITLSQLLEYYPDSRLWQFSDWYGERLGLTKEEADILNFIEGKYVSFSTIERIKLREVALFRAVLEQLETWYRSRHTTTYRDFSRVARSFTMQRYGGFNHYYTAGDEEADIEQKVYEIYNVVFRLAKNQLYKSWQVDDEVDVYNSVQYSVGKSLMRQEIVPVVEPIIRDEVAKQPALMAAEDKLLNRFYQMRWKLFHEEIKERCKDDEACYIEETKALLSRNDNNPMIRSLLFDMMKLLSDKDREESLRMYLRYVRVCRDYPGCKLKPIPRYIAKHLFFMKGSEERFEKILLQYNLNGYWEQALDAVSSVYQIPQKKLELDRTLIRKVEVQHAETVGLLSEVLADDLPEQERNEVLEVREVADTLQTSHPSLDVNQLELLRLFEVNGYVMDRKDVEIFVRSKGLMVNQVIEKINDVCYDVVDDLLIEEEGETYTVSEEYFRKIEVGK